MNEDIYYQSETISYATGTTAKTLRKDITLNSSYERCVGIALFESKSGGIPTYRIGIDDKDKQYISAVHKDMLRSSPQAGLDMNNRFLAMNIKAEGHKVKVSTELPADLTEDIEYDIVFKLVRSAQKS